MEMEITFTQSCPTLCDPVGCSLSDSFVHGISQARLDWVAIPFSRESSHPRTQTGLLYWRQILYYLSHQGNPREAVVYNCFICFT